MNKKVLVTGGAGYIGSITCQVLKENGFTPIIFDNLITGHKHPVKEFQLYQGGLQKDSNLLKEVFAKEKPEAVIHFAAWSLVGESVTDPQKYFLNNDVGTLNLLREMLSAKVLKFVFSSTAATYGEPEKVPIDEDDPKDPTNPYGESKLIIEKFLKWYGQAYNLSSVALRYFNACGAALDGKIGEDHQPESHLIPLTIQAAMGKRKEFKIFGDDYKTPDGTCIRDYIHVLDLAQAHVDALKSFDQKGNEGFRAYNVGTSNGFSVKQVVEMVKEISKIDFETPIGERRAGDPAQLVAKADKIKKELGWSPQYSDLKTIVQSAWKFHNLYPDGYPE